MKTRLKNLWQFPQFFLSIIILLLLSRKIRSVTNLSGTNDIIVHHIEGFKGGLSLGPNIFVRENASQNLIRHELGHSRQSLLLGPLYLLIIGLPSFLWLQAYNLVFRRMGVSYYSFYTEKWAEKWSNSK